MRAVVAAVVLLAFAPSAYAAVAQSAVSTAHDKAENLAEMVLPRDKIIASRAPELQDAVAEQLGHDQRIAALEKTHPGITTAVIQAARDEVAKSYGTTVDLLRHDVAEIYRAQFTSLEIGKLIGFYATPTGQAMIAMSAETSGDTASATDTERKQKAAAMLQNPSPQIKADLIKLMQTGLLPKIHALNPQIAALSARRFDDIDKIAETALPQREDAAIAAFLKDHP